MKRLVFVVLLLGLAVPVFGQSNYGTVTGTVTDAQHLAIAGATVQLTAASTGAIRRVVTDQHGFFEAPALLPDDYELTTDASGLPSRHERCGWRSGRK